jgi:hypothetical protein
MKFPKRHKNHSLEEESITFFREYLPEDWNINSIDRDYGQDLNIEICEEGEYRGLELVVQLKSSNNPNGNDESENITLRVATYNYLWDNLRVVLLIKFVQSENEAYWLLLKDVPEPNQENDTFTVHIPKENTLSNLDWNSISEYVRDVTNDKLRVRRKK